MASFRFKFDAKNEGMIYKDILPEGAEMVFEGKRSRIYQWQQPMFDGTLGTFEKVVRRHASTVIAVEDGKIVLEKQEQPHKKQAFWSCAGGFADEWHEDPLAVAKRELLEETGLVSDLWIEWKILGTKDYVYWENHCYIAKNCRREKEPHLDNGERIEIHHLTFEEFLKLAEDPTFRHKDMLIHFYRMQADPEKLAEFKKLLFGK